MDKIDVNEIGSVCCQEHNQEGTHISETLRDNLTRRLNRIEGQVRGIKGMIQRNVYCDDILNQMSAVQSALHSVSKLLLESHMKTCVMGRLKEEDTAVIDVVYENGI